MGKTIRKLKFVREIPSFLASKNSSGFTRAKDPWRSLAQGSKFRRGKLLATVFGLAYKFGSYQHFEPWYRRCFPFVMSAIGGVYNI